VHWSLSEPFSAAEWLSMAAVVAIAVLTPPGARARLSRAWSSGLRRLGRHPAFGIGVLSLAWNLLPLALVHPRPGAHDEFSYLLMADTFLEGRLSMPTHPMWRSFETFHVIFEPTYASKFPPLQGLVLAFGQLVFRDPLLGVKLSGSLASVALWWALAGWLPRRWAMVGAVVFVFHFGGFSYWSQSLFGGAAACLGGSLVFGAYPRLVARPRAAEGALLGLGLCLLAASRPYEGLLLGLPIVGALTWKAASGRKRGIALSLLPTLLLVAAGGGALALYNRAVTGKALTLPYDVYTERYGYARPFRFQRPRIEGELDHEMMKRFVETFEMRHYRASWREHFRPMARFYAAPLLFPPLLVLPLLFRERRYRFPLALALVAVAGSTLTTFILPHYAAPFAALQMMLLTLCLRRMGGVSWRGRRVGAAARRVLLTSWFYALILGSVVSALARSRFDGARPWNVVREEIAREVAAGGGRHLIFVRYAPGHSPHEEWVYNRADIDDAAVVWAREVNEAQDVSLGRYFCSRTLWRVEPGGPSEIRLVKLRPPVCSGPQESVRRGSAPSSPPRPGRGEEAANAAGETSSRARAG
jgi:hypothetical protein